MFRSGHHVRQFCHPPCKTMSDGAPQLLEIIVDQQREEVGSSKLDDNVSLAVVAAVTRAQHLPQRGDLRAWLQQLKSGELLRSDKRKPEQPLRTRILRALEKKVTVFYWAPRMTAETVFKDVIAGITVGTVDVPQGISGAIVAGVPLINGLYTQCIPALVYAFFGTSRQLVVGSTSPEGIIIATGLMGKLTIEECPAWYKAGGPNSLKTQAQLCPAAYMNLVSAHTALCGIFQLCLAFLNLGFVIKLISAPAIGGLISGQAVLINLAQLKNVLGVNMSESDTIHGVFQALQKATQTQTVNGYAVLFAGIWIVWLYLHRLTTTRLTEHFRGSRPRLSYSLAILRNLGPLTVLIVGTVILQNAEWLRAPPYNLGFVGTVPPGMPPYAGTAVAIGKRMAAKQGFLHEYDVGQELRAQGISNIFAALFSCFPATGSFSRTVVMDIAGGQTQFAGLVAAVMMIFVLLFVTPLFYFIPKFVLACIVIVTASDLIDLREGWHLWRCSKADFFVWLTSFMVCMFVGILQGIGSAIGASILVMMYETARPEVPALWRIPSTTTYSTIKQGESGELVSGVFVCRPATSIYFANAWYIEDILRAHLENLEAVDKVHYIVLDMVSVASVDSTAATIINDALGRFRREGVELAFANVSAKVQRNLKSHGLWDVIGQNWIFPTVHEAVEHCKKLQLQALS